LVYKAPVKPLRKIFPLSAAQEALRGAGIDGWLFFDFRGMDPIARRILALDPNRVSTRQWFYFVPAEGEPRKLVHGIETNALKDLPGEAIVYVSWQSMREGLVPLLGSVRRVAMQYSPLNEVPYVSKVDAGTVELVRSVGVEVISSCDLVQLFDATLTPGQLEGHRRVAKVLRSLVDEVFSFVASNVAASRSLNERAVVSFLEKRLADHELCHDHSPIIAAGPHSADPHYEVPLTGSATLQRGDVLLVDVWAKERTASSVYADITWTAFIGNQVPKDVQSVFAVVRNARDAVIARARKAFRSGEAIRGFELDRVTRGVIDEAGYGKYFIHRTGHSIHEEVHGNGANLDDLETHDTRLMIPRTLSSVEPGIYLPGRFGIRSEVDLYHAESDVEVTGPPHQDEIRPLLA
jgi:Xaa-Pro dipeptidase